MKETRPCVHCRQEGKHSSGCPIWIHQQIKLVELGVNETNARLSHIKRIVESIRIESLKKKK